MKNQIVVLLVILAQSLNAQTIDYNTDRGVAVEGYDVVSYFSNTAVEGKDQYRATHDGVTYKFSSRENLNVFNANPIKYIPQYGGYCAYAVASKAKKVSIDPETFEIRNGKLFLFYNSWGNNTLESWQKESPDVLKAKADDNWKKLKQKG